MPGVVYGLDMPNGFAGTSAATPDRIKETVINQCPTTLNGGVVNNGAVAFKKAGGASVVGDTTITPGIATFFGFVDRQVQTNINYANQNGPVAYANGAPMPVLTRGKITMQCVVGTPAQWGAVYCRTATNSAIPTGVLGGLEAAADGTNTFLVPDCYFDGPADANGNVTVVLTKAH